MKARQLLNVAVLFGTAALSGATVVAFWPSRTQSVSAADNPEDLRDESFRHEHELVLVYLGRASCAWCRRPEMRDALNDARDRLRLRAAQEGWRFKAYGVGIDYGPNESLDHLRRLGPFDAISAGDGWRSLPGALLATGRLAGPRATPQLLVLRRQSRVSGTERDGFAEILSEQLLVRKVGLFEIQDWLAGGAVIRLPPFREDVGREEQ